MALRVLCDVFGLAWRHPLVSIGILALFTPPFFPIIRFFSPLLISTAVLVVAMISLGPSSKGKKMMHHGASTSQDDDVSFAFHRKAAPPVIGTVWEDDNEGIVQENEQENVERGVFKNRNSSTESSSWMDLVRNLEALGLAWADQKLKNHNCPGSTLDDSNVSILQEVFELRTDPATVSEASELSNVVGNEEKESKPSQSCQESVAEDRLQGHSDESPTDQSIQRTTAVEEVVAASSDPDEIQEGGLEHNAPVAAEVEQENVVVQEVPALVVMPRSSSAATLMAMPAMSSATVVGESASVHLCPSPDIDDGASRDEPEIKESGTILSPNSAKPLSASEKKLSVIESAVDAIEGEENVKSHEASIRPSSSTALPPAALRPSISAKVTDIIEKLTGFVEDGVPSSKPTALLFKPRSAAAAAGKKKKKKSKNEKSMESSDDDGLSSGHEEAISEADSDSGVPIVPDA
ncbi:unnamed protein product [Sphagnum jensenii]|uniref:Uncharacterized protein n=1 Tax=Sphagnum jensenii TaxID=128206 RepID=A0ABP1AD69_9BRYO